MKAKFYICRHCGNLIVKIHDAGVPVSCCGEKMEELIPNTVEASGEKHKPVVSVENGIVRVSVGSVAHPMVPEHSIEWVFVETDKGIHRLDLQPGEAPEAVFSIPGEKPVAVYEYCNLHGLWKTSL